MRQMNPKRCGVPIAVLLGCAAMAWVEMGLQPIYPVKSALKLLIFSACAGGYALLCRDTAPFRCFRRPDRRGMRAAIGLAVCVFLFLLGGWAVLSPWFDLSAIPDRLAGKEGITAAVFPLAALYISFCNSLLEEFFFRGFAFLTLRHTGAGAPAWWFSALAFALYHVCIMDGWFHPVLFLLLTAGLIGAGLLFDWLDRRGSLWPAWLVHLAANLAINTIGLRLFGIL